MNIILYKLKLIIIFYYNWIFYMENSITMKKLNYLKMLKMEAFKEDCS